MLKSMYYRLTRKIQIIRNKLKWKKKNKHNYTYIDGTFDITKVKIGNKTYGKINAITYENQQEYLSIGAFCSIAENVTFLLGGEHSYRNIMTYPFKVKCLNEHVESFSKGPIIVEDDVWIGYGSIILSGVKIGQGAIIGAGSVVSRDIPPYAIYAGGKIIKNRFDEEVVQELLKLNLKNIVEEKISENVQTLYTELNKTNYKEVIEGVKKIIEK